MVQKADMQSGVGLRLQEVRAVVFSGGGSRCLWQAGMWDALSKQPDFKPTTIVAASAGATMACLVIAGKSEAGLRYFKQVTAGNQKNAYWGNLFRGKPVFPHYRIYRQAIYDLLTDDDLETLKRGPQIRVLIAQPPAWLGSRSGSFVGIAAYMLEKRISYPMHPVLSTRLGYKPLISDVSECSSVKELADLLLQSSCTPPFVPVMKRNGRPALDGGLIDNVPADFVNDLSGLKLVLLSRQYPKNRIPRIRNRLYLQPSQSVPIAKWDYTNPNGLQFAYDLGIKDADEILESL